MNPELDRLRAFVRSLARRERGLVLVRVVLNSAVVVAGLITVLAIAAAARWDTSTTGALTVLWLGIGGWFAAIVPVLRHWPAHGDMVRQARLVAAMDPALRGRLITSVDYAEDERGGSEALIALVASRAARRIEGITPAQVHPAGSTNWRAAIATVAGMCALLALLVVPGGPVGLLAYWQDSGQASAAVVDLDMTDEMGAARVGDIQLRYVYPDYMGLETVTIPNSTGDVHGPPGTVVSISLRAADTVNSAALIVYEAAPLEAEVLDGRSIRGSFTIAAEPGEWQMVLDVGGEPRTTAAFEIVPEGDAPPDVSVEGEDGYELAIDGAIALAWLARDDFGLRKVTLEVDGREVQLLSEPQGRATERRDFVTLSPIDLGLSEGDVVDVAIVAWDNDSFAGSKAGRSRPIRIEVLGEGARDRRRTERLSALADAMIIALADHLVEPWPVADTSGGLARWGETLSERYAPINDIIDEYWDDVPAWAPDRPLVEAVVDSARELIRYTQVSYTPGSADIPADASFTTTAGLRDDAIVALEDAILFLDSLRDAAAFAEVMKRTQEASTLAENLAEMLQQEDVDPLAMAAQLDQLEAVLREMTAKLSELQRGPLKELLNQRTQELSSLLEQAREAMANGDMEEARELMKRIARQLEQMAESVAEQQARQQDADGDAMAEARDLRDELQRLEDTQRELQEEVQEIRESADGERFSDNMQLWEDLDVVVARLAVNSGTYREALDAAQRSFNERERSAALEEAFKQLQQSAEARDINGAMQEAYRSRSSLQSSQMSHRMAERQRGGNLPGPGAPALRDMQGDLYEADRILQQIAQNDAASSPEMSEQLQQLSERQQQLQQETESAKQQMEQLGQETGMQPKGGSESLEQAGERMGQAGQGLRQGQAMSAEGSQGAAAQRIAEAREALEQSMQQAAERSRQQRGGEQGEGQGEGQGGPGGEQSGQGDQPGGRDRQGTEPSGRKIEIPGPEEFRTPEEYRRALLEGMEGDVPEEYRALKRRYYEELVNQ